jgi:hypothetical protein
MNGATSTQARACEELMNHTDLAHRIKGQTRLRAVRGTAREFGVCQDVRRHHEDTSSLVRYMFLCTHEDSNIVLLELDETGPS